MSMFELNNDVPEFKIPAAGKYTTRITNVALGQSSKGTPMIKVELTIPAGEELAAQGITMPCKVFDNVLDHPAEGCQRKKNNFLRATGATSPESLSALIGKQIDVKTKVEHDEQYGDRLTVTQYIKDTLKDVVDVPF